jgi:hypothetical protein
MEKTILLPFIAFVYTLLYVVILDVDIIIFDYMVRFSEDGSVSGRAISHIVRLIFLVLTGGMVLTAVKQFNRIKGFFAFCYFPSLLASFLMPLLFDSLNRGSFLSFPWFVTGTLTLGMNLLFGPAMFFLLTYHVMRFIKKRKSQEG